MHAPLQITYFYRIYNNNIYIIWYLYVYACGSTLAEGKSSYLVVVIPEAMSCERHFVQDHQLVLLLLQAEAFTEWPKHRATSEDKHSPPVVLSLSILSFQPSFARTRISRPLPPADANEWETLAVRERKIEGDERGKGMGEGRGGGDRDGLAGKWKRRKWPLRPQFELQFRRWPMSMRRGETGKACD